MLKITRISLLIAAVIFASSASAVTTTDSLAVSATVTASCHITAGSSVAFGPLDPTLGTNTDGTGTITTTCSNTTTYDIGLGTGTAPSATTSTRQMNDGGGTPNYLNYSLYSDSSRTTNWGDVVGTDTVAGTGNGSAQNTTVYGRVPSDTTAVPGSYTDTVTITVTY